MDTSKFSFAFDEHTKFVRQIFCLVGYASDSNKVLKDENMMKEIRGK